MEGKPFKNLLTITYPHKSCKIKPCDDEFNVLAVANHLVEETLCTAEEFIGADIEEVFYYKLPKKIYKDRSSNDDDRSKIYSSSFESIDNKLNITEKDYFDYNAHSSVTDQTSTIETPTKDDNRHPNDIEWSTIDGFNLRDCAGQIRDYIELWKLAPNTKCTLLMRDEAKLVANKGLLYYVDAVFSNPAPKCPNPLAVAKVHFYIHIPELMPKYYPVMVTYRFEGYKSIFYSNGHKQIRSMDFQRLFIDTIIHTKLNFYAELYRCRFPNDKELKDITEDKVDEESQYVCEESLITKEDEEYTTEEFNFLDKIDLK